MPRWVDLDNPKIIKEGRDKFGNVLYGIPPETQTADVRPVVRGRWIINSDGYYPYCSNCKNEPQGRTMTDFCPNCGADMRGGDSE